MRDRRFVAKHRGGPLSKNKHYLMALWAAACAEHVLSVLWKNDIDQRPINAVRQARAWAGGEISVGDARKAAVAAHASARASRNAAATAAARAAGHAAATAHMADHCMATAWYALKGAELGGNNAERERRWQVRKLPKAIRDLVVSGCERRRIYPKQLSKTDTP
jgi:hypothetical protein